MSLSLSIESSQLFPDPGMQRKVDPVTRRALEQTRNELLCDSILKTAKVIFANNEAVSAEG
jgi:hypothetical protein